MKVVTLCKTRVICHNAKPSETVSEVSGDEGRCPFCSANKPLSCFPSLCFWHDFIMVKVPKPYVISTESHIHFPFNI